MPATTPHMFLLLALMLGQQGRQVSLIEHGCSIMGRTLQSTCDANDLTRQLDRIWYDILQEDIRNLYQSMPNNCLHKGQR